MRAIALFLLLSPAAFAADVPAPESVDPGKRLLSESLLDSLKRVSWELAATESGRRLLALTDRIRVVERDRQPGPPVRFEAGDPEIPADRRNGGEPLLVVDRGRADALSLLDFEALFFLARWRAAARLPIELAETEAAARQALLVHAVEKAAARPEFGERLREAVRLARASIEERRRTAEYAAAKGERAAPLFPGRPPGDTLARIAFDLYLFALDPWLFYESVADATAETRGLPSLDRAEDFLELHGARADGVRYAAAGRVAVAGGRGYPARTAKAAERLRDPDTLARVREGLGPYRTVGAERARAAVNAFLRSVP